MKNLVLKTFFLSGLLTAALGLSACDFGLGDAADALGDALKPIKATYTCNCNVTSQDAASAASIAGLYFGANQAANGEIATDGGTPPEDDSRVTGTAAAPALDSETQLDDSPPPPPSLW